MKYLSDYIQEKQTALFKETGTFFAFCKDQFDEKKVEGVKYFKTNGIIYPQENSDKLIQGLEKIHAEGIAQDIAENGKESIIKRELYNHEAFYTYEIDDTFDAVKIYGFTREEVQNEFTKEVLARRERGDED